MALAAYTAIYVCLSTSGLLLLRRSLPRLGHGQLLAELSSQPEVFVGGLLYVLSFLTFLLALRRFQLSLVYPVFLGCGYVAVALGSWLILDERFSVSRVVGITVVGVGLVLVTR